MSEQQEVVLTKKKSKEQLWKEILEKARESLAKNAEIKKRLIQKTAEILEEKEMPLYQICGAMTKWLRDYASGRYIRECLDDKYKNPVMKREEKEQPPQQQDKKEENHEEIAAVTSANDSKNVTEQIPNVAQPSTEVIEIPPNKEEELTPIAKESFPDLKTRPELHTEYLKQQEEEEQIRPEDYNINDLHKYSSEFKDRIIIHLDEKIRQLQESNER